MDDSPPAVFPAAVAIPVDLFVSKKHPGLSHGDLGFSDSSGNLVFKARRVSTKSSPAERVLFDALGNPLVSICRRDDGSWQGFKGDNAERNLIFRVQRTLHKFFRTELEVFLVEENAKDSASEFKVIGFPFQKSCTIYRGNSIVAQTSLMYKLNQIWVKRSKFRLTIFPVSVDHMLVAALIVIFLDS